MPPFTPPSTVILPLSEPPSPPLPRPPPLCQGRASLPVLAFSTRTYSLFGVPRVTHFVSDFLASALPPPPSYHTPFSLLSYPPASTLEKASCSLATRASSSASSALLGRASELQVTSY